MSSAASDPHKMVLVGLPESGKTSFLAALLYFVDSNSPDKNLEQVKMSSNTNYTTAIVQAWLKGDKQERTKVVSSTSSTKTEAEIFLRNKTTLEELTVHVPDFFGETFENQFVDRQVELDYLDLIRSATGAIVFIHPEKLRLPILIEDIEVARKIAEKIDQGAGELDNTETAATELTTDSPKEKEAATQEQAVAFKKEEIPTQTVICDLLEAHLENLASPPLVLAIVISAWDLILKREEKLSPLKWIEKNLPMFYQYLETNADKMTFRAFGVSAQGGNIEDPTELAKLRSLDEPAERIRVQEDDLEHKNIGSTIEWILQQWRKTE